ncbi:MAG: YajQ family cyclic di-GMP-binding protein [Coriobacteriia bacterium]|nr:YajQ family cyclic di-GMP-binding protein [Coriobacteriia bacterium]MCL2746369.1 YajQ family cyclic di-GMP-binding protein [Coriobacteriia bacterium]MCL2870803.1 YajQ family cyclic di-GMP-binding protein [Coriobacteriia bacterium]
MGKDASFDIVSEVDYQEVDNAFQQAAKELKQRYDLKDSGATLDYDKAKHEFTLTAPSDFIGGQVKDVLNSKLIRRDIDLKAVQWSDPVAASLGNVRFTGTIVSGIEETMIKKLNKDIKAQKFKKVKTVIEGDKIRVSSPSRDDLQAVITFVKEADYDIPLQFVNYR